MIARLENKRSLAPLDGASDTPTSVTSTRGSGPRHALPESATDPLQSAPHHVLRHPHLTRDLRVRPTPPPQRSDALVERQLIRMLVAVAGHNAIIAGSDPRIALPEPAVPDALHGARHTRLRHTHPLADALVGPARPPQPQDQPVPLHRRHRVPAARPIGHGAIVIPGAVTMRPAYRASRRHPPPSARSCCSSAQSARI